MWIGVSALMKADLGERISGAMSGVFFVTLKIFLAGAFLAVRRITEAELASVIKS